MNLREFKRRINEAERDLKRIRLNYLLELRYIGVCQVIHSNVDGVFDSTAMDDFYKHFKPNMNTSKDSYFIGVRTEKNIEKRIVFLRMFEQWAITYKAYLEY